MGILNKNIPSILLFSLAILTFTTLGKAQNKSNNFNCRVQYPKSKLIKKFEWINAPTKYPGSASDMHWWTWGMDDNIYILDDDGENFGGRYWYAHILKASGMPPNLTVEILTDFEGYDFRKTIPKKLLLRYVCGIVAVDTVLYVCLYDYDWNVPSKQVDYDSIYNRMSVLKPWENIDPAIIDNLGFINRYSKHGGLAGIIKSVDNGQTWTNIPKENTPAFFGANFGAPAFLTFGKGNSETPSPLGNYVYAVSNDVNWISGDNVRMARVHRDSILYRSAWQFFAGNDKKKQPGWVKDENKSLPIFSDPGHVGHPSITYNKSLKRYILSIFSDAVPHTENATDTQYSQWDKASELQLYESELPWGPWSIFYSEKPWGGNNHTNYLGQIPSKWFSNDGLSGTILFSGDYTRDGAYYGLMTQSFKLTIK